MKMKRNKGVYCIIILLILIIGVQIWIAYDAPPMLHMPHGKLVKTLASPDGCYDLLIYQSPGGGATVADSVTADIIDHDRNKTYTIYYNYAETRTNAKWLDADKVEINGIILHVRTMRYNYNWFW